MDLEPRPFRSASVQTGLASLCLGLSAALQLADAAARFWTIATLSAARDGGGLTLETAESIDSLALALLVARVGLFLVTATAFLAWVHRSVANAGALGYAMPATPAGAVGNWFIPCYNLAWGWKIGQELWRSSRAEGGVGTSGLVAGWWLTYLGAAVVDRAATTMARAELRPTLEGLVSAAYGDVVADGLLLVSAVLGILVVREITRGHELLFRGSRDSAMAPPTTF